MPIKESSDELNPDVAIKQSSVVARRPARSFSDYVGLSIATCGVGYFPIAPGTLGSMVGVIVYLLLIELVLRFFTPSSGLPLYSVFLAAQLVLITVISLAGIWAATRTEKLSGRKDPGKVVIDEVAGQLISFLPVQLFYPDWITIITAFMLFRLFDIIKPYPARRLESLESGLGIMADDVVAGAYAAVGVSVIAVIRLFV
jgi:phosphatidylglycerophosphatase A